jgi:hypothetical protein
MARETTFTTNFCKYEDKERSVRKIGPNFVLLPCIIQTRNSWTYLCLFLAHSLSPFMIKKRI